MAGTEPTEWVFQVGRRLASVRRAAGMSLADVERASNGEFMGNTLSYYEKGMRGLSLPRLARLAQFYDVHLSELLPGMIPVSSLSEALRRPGDLIVDLTALDQTKGTAAARLRHFCHSIIDQRGTEPRDGLLRLRQSDQAAVAALLGVASNEAAGALDDLARTVAG
jgi:transcriptional regulator with XRE-family HTH domain